MNVSINVVLGHSFNNALGTLDMNILEAEVPTVVVSLYYRKSSKESTNFVG